MLKRILSNSALYLGASLLTSGINFSLLPLYTRLLSPTDFGTLGLISATSGVLSTIIGLSPRQFFTVEFKKNSETQLQRLVAVALWVPLILALPAFSLLYLMSGLLGMSQVPTWILAAMVLLPFFGNSTAILLTAYRMAERPIKVMAVQLGGVGAEHGLSLLCLLLFGWAWQARFLGIVGATVSVGSIASLLLWRAKLLSLRLSRKALRKYLDFLLPLIPHTLGYWAINAQDRFFIARMCSLEDTGFYSVAYRLCGVFPLLTGAIFGAFTPHFYKKTFNANDKVQVVRFTYLYLGMVFVIYVLFVVIVVPFTPLLLGERYAGSVEYVPWLAGAYAIGAVRDLSVGYLFRASKNRLIGAISLSAAVLNAILNWVLIPRSGPIGAAMATTITFFFIAVITLWFGLRSIDMPWLTPFRRLERSGDDEN